MKEIWWPDIQGHFTFEKFDYWREDLAQYTAPTKQQQLTCFSEQVEAVFPSEISGEVNRPPAAIVTDIRCTARLD